MSEQFKSDIKIVKGCLNQINTLSDPSELWSNQGLVCGFFFLQVEKLDY